MYNCFLHERKKKHSFEFEKFEKDENWIISYTNIYKITYDLNIYTSYRFKWMWL